MIFREDVLRDQNIRDLPFGSDQRLVPAHAGDSYAVAGEVEGVIGFVLVSGPDAVIQGMMARPRGARDGR